VSFLIDSDLLSMLERKQVPPKLEHWVQNNEAEIFLSVEWGKDMSCLYSSDTHSPD
jgi:hypothetical protein